MFGSSILEVAIGMIFVYLFISLICSAINEGIASLINKRGKNLFEGVKNLLNDPTFTGLAQQLYTHGLVERFFAGGRKSGETQSPPLLYTCEHLCPRAARYHSTQGLKESWSEVIQRRQEDLGALQSAAEAEFLRRPTSRKSKRRRRR